MKKITKKVFSLALVAVLTLSMGMVAFAKDSTENPNPGTGSESTGNPDTDKPGTPSTENPGTPSTENPGSQGQTVVGDLSTAGSLASATIDGKNVAGTVSLSTVSPSFYATMMNAAKVKNLFNNAGVAFDKATYLASVDIHFTGNIPKSGIQFTFNVKDVTTKDTIYAIHQKKDGTYELVKCRVPEDGKVSFTLYSLSPVAFFNVEGATSTTAGNGKTTKTSPKTGAF